MTLAIRFLLATCFISVSHIANATDSAIDPVYLDSVAIINVAGFGHFAGTLEIKVTNGISDLKGANCDSNYISTRNTGEGFKEMVAVLLAAHTSQKPVNLGITDNPAHNAFPGRCSLIYAVIQK